MKASLAADTMTTASFIRDGEKLTSSSQRFELGFFSPGKSKSRYLGIWFRRVPDTVVWVANRDRPISGRNAVLTISNNGNLVLLSQTNGTIWSTNVSSDVKNPVAQLRDDGNLVIRDNSSDSTAESYLWQSFDHPSDTLLQDMKLGWDFKSGLERLLSSWQSAEDPSPGRYTYGLDIHVLPKMCTFNGSVKFTCSGQWDGTGFVSALSYTNFIYKQFMTENKDEFVYWYEAYNRPSIMTLKLNPSGFVTRQIWDENSNKWDELFSVPDQYCGKYGYCGANTICSLDQTPMCECLEGFKLKSQVNQTRPIKCERSHSSECTRGTQFKKLDNVKAPDFINVSLNQSMNLEQCAAECLKNCTCKAYANSNVTEGSGCLMWYGDLLDSRRPIRNFTGQSVYLQVPTSESGNKKLLWILVVLVLPLVLLPSFYIFCRRRRKCKEKETENTETNQDLLAFDINMGITTRTNEFGEVNGDGKDKGKDSWLPLFSLASVAAATENFSMQCKLGEGGFGPVYKGRLFNGQEVAVKRLSSQSGQGLKEFKNEMMLIAELQHRNLVRILGCCVEQGEKILILEYMPNKSLDVYLFDPIKKRLLDWEARIRIIQGIAQGLLYLHQYSRLRIIHRDLKASNVLLDKDMNPKISDFGLARMFGGDELQGNTKRIVGTYGYMSPEYALDGLFSIKSDVFSFGILMLETLSSRKNTGVYNTDSFNLLGHAWDLWKHERVHELMDPVILQDEIPLPMLMRYVNVALLCVQENAADRPTMSDVVSMISNEHLNLPFPKKLTFVKGKNVKNSSYSTSGTSEICSVNDVTVSLGLCSINFTTTRISPRKASSPEVPAHIDRSTYVGCFSGANPPTLKSDMKVRGTLATNLMAVRRLDSRLTCSWMSRIFLLLLPRIPGSYGTHRFAELRHQIYAHHAWSRRRISPKHRQKVVYEAQLESLRDSHRVQVENLEKEAANQYDQGLRHSYRCIMAVLGKQHPDIKMDDLATGVAEHMDEEAAKEDAEEVAPMVIEEENSPPRVIPTDAGEASTPPDATGDTPPALEVDQLTEAARLADPLSS
ncbi:Receptor-like serine/threonine-protein kinase SD1-6 [Citrus sinensis]|uniref:Receptor-like serine/threonine-protein kinase SD1-6 n=1 Tax=Citrus sinensis TaxID=2711 RepID=A0ACB8P075_CITSI|nr:Receptor-like serine/threonine-protein kinase SD1-6 [Citrus sinensis]KAH9803005.1 Receptor-like serine/threonine-protein kinase SD1-6 [Citrus sinensis]